MMHYGHLVKVSVLLLYLLQGYVTFVMDLGHPIVSRTQAFALLRDIAGSQPIGSDAQHLTLFNDKQVKC